MKLLVAGAGPGGLVAALALRHAGHEVVVLERSPELRTAGAGLVVQTNAMRMLARLGLDGPVRRAGCVLGQGRIQTAEGQLLGLSNLQQVGMGHGQPTVAIHRKALSETLAERLPASSLVFGAEVLGFEQDAQGVRVRSSAGDFEAQGLIGADGLHSKVREGLFGSIPPRYAGYTCWRGICPVGHPLGAGAMSEAWGRGKRFGIVPIGTELTYWFATENAPAEGRDQQPKAEVLARFADFAPPTGALIEATPEQAILRNDIVDLEPLERWVEGRVGLLGDAAHAMTPNMGQGAGQAIEDAVVLGALLERMPLVEALSAYEATRLPRARQFVERSWSMGSMAQWENGLARWLRDSAVRLTPESVMVGQLDQVFGVEVPA